MSKAEAKEIMNLGATKYPSTRRAPINRFAGWGGSAVWSTCGGSWAGPTGQTGPAGAPDAGQKGPNYSDCRSCAEKR